MFSKAEAVPAIDGQEFFHRQRVKHFFSSRHHRRRCRRCRLQLFCFNLD